MCFNKQSNEQYRRRHHRRMRLMVVNAHLMLRKGKRHLPPGLRAVLGLLLFCLGLLGFLPVLGFWMIPLGLALLATDIPPLGRWLKKKLHVLRRRYRK
jgi:hypothetical protein